VYALRLRVYQRLNKDTRMNTKEKIAVMQAFEDGKEIFERPLCHGGEWKSCEYPTWNWVSREYMAKEEPREIWVNVYDYGPMGAYRSEFDANVCISEGGKTIKFREVMNDE